MIIQYNKKKLEAALSDFQRATGVNISMSDASFSHIAGVSGAHCKYCSIIQTSPAGKCACMKSDLQLFQRCAASMTTQMQICHAGLMDIAVPIIYNDCILAYLIMGQIKTDYNFTEMEEYMVTDDASAVEYLGMKVKIVEGDERNIKVTTPMDLKIAEMLLEEMQ